jgi:hypothetical protein
MLVVIIMGDTKLYVDADLLCLGCTGRLRYGGCCDVHGDLQVPDCSYCIAGAIDQLS